MSQRVMAHFDARNENSSRISHAVLTLPRDDADKLVTMSMTPGEHLTRGAERITLPSPIAAIFADADAQLIEISLVGTRAVHTSAISSGRTVDLEFLWRGEPIRLSAKVARAEVRSVHGRQTFISGLHFCGSIFESPVAIRKIIGLLAAEPIPSELWRRHARLAERSASAPYLECALIGGNWRKQRVWVPQQPREGFTMIAPENESVADPFCRCYETATPDERRLIRASAELAIAEEPARNGWPGLNVR